MHGEYPLLITSSAMSVQHVTSRHIKALWSILFLSWKCSVRLACITTNVSATCQFYCRSLRGVLAVLGPLELLGPLFGVCRESSCSVLKAAMACVVTNIGALVSRVLSLATANITDFTSHIHRILHFKFNEKNGNRIQLTVSELLFVSLMYTV